MGNGYMSGRRRCRPACYVRLISALVGFLSLAPSSYAEPVRAIACQIRDNTIDLDGRLGEPVWRELEEHGSFSVTGKRSPHHGFEAKQASPQTSFRVFSNREFLYVGIIAFADDRSHQRPSADGRTVFGEDKIHVYLATDESRNSVLRVGVTSTGAVTVDGDVGGGLPVAAVHSLDSAWSAEVAIPLQVVPPESDLNTNVAGFNVSRHRMWSTPAQTSFWVERRDVQQHPCLTSMLVFGTPAILPRSVDLAQEPTTGALHVISRWNTIEKSASVILQHWMASNPEGTQRHTDTLGPGRPGGRVRVVEASFPIEKSGVDQLVISVTGDREHQSYRFPIPYFGWHWADIRSRIGQLKNRATLIRKKAMDENTVTPEHASVLFYTDWLMSQFEEETFPPSRLLAWLEEAEDLASGSVRLKARTGLQNRAIWSDLDQSYQPYTLWIPLDYTSEKKWPVLVVLHGGMPDQGGWGSPYWEHGRSPYQAIRTVDGYHVADWLTVDMREDFIIVAPRARRSGVQPWWDAYEGPAEDDVLATIDDVRQSFNIDETRVHLFGLSLGGWGATSLATKMPDRWASVVANCVGWKAFRHRSPAWKRWPSFRRFTAMRYNPLDLAENLVDIPFFFQLSDRDRGDLFGRPLAHRLQRLGGNFLYWEKPDGHHCQTFARAPGKIARWLRSHERNPNPTSIVHKTGTLRHGRSHWLSIEQFLEPFRFGSVNARITGERLVEIEASNIARLALRLGSGLIQKDEPLRIMFNHLIAFEGLLPASGLVRVGPHGLSVPQAGEKRPYLEGPISDVVMRPFMITYGTVGDPVANAANEQAATDMAESWRKHQGVHPRIKSDRAIDVTDIETFNLICFGGPESHAIVKKAATSLPVAFLPDGFRLGDVDYRGEALGLRMVYPNPLNPDRLIQINAGAPSALKKAQQTSGECDYFIFDAGVGSSKAGRLPDALVIGWFDQQWRFRKEFLFESSR